MGFGRRQEEDLKKKELFLIKTRVLCPFHTCTVTQIYVTIAYF